MTTGKELIERLGAKISKDPAVAANFGAIYKFVLEGDGGGTWIVGLDWEESKASLRASPKARTLAGRSLGL